MAEMFTPIKLIGKGAFASVKLARQRIINTSNENKIVAVKIQTKTGKVGVFAQVSVF